MVMLKYTAKTLLFENLHACVYAEADTDTYQPVPFKKLNEENLNSIIK